jgi:hypothetical protein
MKIKTDKLQSIALPIMTFLKKHRVTLFIVFFLAAYTFLVYRIGNLVNGDPPQTAIDAQLTTVKRLKIDQESIDRILELNEQNVEVRSLFEQARENPFTE